MNQNSRGVAVRHEWHNVRWFRRVAPVYDFVEVFVAHVRRKVVECSGLPRGARVLDAACGTGAQSIAFAERGFSVVGVDLSPDMLARAKKKLRKGHDAAFLRRDASSVPYADSHFDLATVSFGLHDMPEEVGAAVLREMRRATKPEGKIVIVDYDVPRDCFSASLGRAVAKLWEGKYYDHFLKVGLGHYLNAAQLTAGEKKSFMFGNIQMVICANRET